MLSASEIKNQEFKRGIGYSKRSVDEFISEIARDYEAVCKENVELKDKMTALSEGLQYYKSMEKTLQKALVMAQKVSDDEQEKASNNAKSIERKARIKADEVISKAKSDLDTIFRQTDDLNRRFELYKSHVKNLITTQLDLINSDAYNISINDLEGYLKLKENLEDVRDFNPETDTKEEDSPEHTKDNLINRIPDESAEKEESVENNDINSFSSNVLFNDYNNSEGENEQNTEG